MKVALAQINATVGDIDGNGEKIRRAVEQAKGLGADLVVLSQNIFAIDPMAILETDVAATMVDGRFVHADENVL